MNTRNLVTLRFENGALVTSGDMLPFNNAGIPGGEKTNVGPNADELTYVEAQQLTPPLPQPSYYAQGATVEQVFPLAGSGNATSRDRTSQRAMTAYLDDRMKPEARFEGSIEIELSDGFGVRYRPEYRGSVFDPRKVVRVTGLALLAVNVVTNLGPFIENTAVAGANITDAASDAWFNATHNTSNRQVMVPGDPHKVTLTF